MSSEEIIGVSTVEDNQLEGIDEGISTAVSKTLKRKQQGSLDYDVREVKKLKLYETISPASNNSDHHHQCECREYMGWNDSLPPIEGVRSITEWQCLNRISEGSYGVVYRARDKKTDEIVAVKQFKLRLENEYPASFLTESKALRKAQHLNVVKIKNIAIGHSLNDIFMVLEFVEHDLGTMLDMMQRKGRRFLPGEIKCVLKQLLAAVAHMHSIKLLHRDLKPSNVLVSNKGILKVADFGLAREQEDTRPLTPIVATLWYRAPEVLLRAREYSTSIDMWAVGCIFAELVLMDAMFPGTTELNQINKIFETLGTPNEHIWPGFNQLPGVIVIEFNQYPGVDLRKQFWDLTDRGFRLLLQFLQYDPNRRISANDALIHEYLYEFP